MPGLELLDAYRVQIGFALLAGWILWSSRSELAQLLGRAKQTLAGLTSPPPTLLAAPLEIDEDTADFQALRRLQARFERAGCPEGLAAVDTCLTHFFHRSS